MKGIEGDRETERGGGGERNRDRWKGAVERETEIEWGGGERNRVDNPTGS